MLRLLFPCSLALCVLVGCSSASPAMPITPGTPRSPDGQGYCCVPETPSCNCFSLGGFRVDGNCAEPAISRVCDAAPPAITRTTDVHGCTYYEVISSQSCLLPPDAGSPTSDAGAPDAATP